MKFRHEYKYRINYFDYLILKQRIQLLMDVDPHASESGQYFIRSLYFDNIYDKALKEKLYGVNNREKFRIRIYNNDFSHINLEKKSKINSLCNKVSTCLSREETEKILKGDIEWMIESGDKLVQEFYLKIKNNGLAPKVIVDYTREPYIFKAGNVRLTFDYNIKTGMYNHDIFDIDMATVPAMDSPILLEVKYDEFIPSLIKDALQLENRRSGAFSKYAACRMYG